jgi:hypothetical protein
MRTRTVTVREGENVGPVEWSHPIAKDMPALWRDAERDPDSFTFTEYRRQIISICMYDGWPYWTPRPAVLFVGPLGGGEWAFFDSYAVGPGSIQRKASVDRSGEAGETALAGSTVGESAVPNEDSADAQPTQESTP